MKGKLGGTIYLGRTRCIYKERMTDMRVTRYRAAGMERAKDQAINM